MLAFPAPNPHLLFRHLTSVMSTCHVLGSPELLSPPFLKDKVVSLLSCLSSKLVHQLYKLGLFSWCLLAFIGFLVTCPRGPYSGSF